MTLRRGIVRTSSIAIVAISAGACAHLLDLDEVTYDRDRDGSVSATDATPQVDAPSDIDAPVDAGTAFDASDAFVAEGSAEPADASYSTVVLEDHPVAYYRFDLDPPSNPATAIDSAGHHDGTYAAMASITAGLVQDGHALSVDVDSGAIVNVPVTGDFRTPETTLECWVRLRSPRSSGVSHLISFGTAADGPFLALGVKFTAGTPVLSLHLNNSGASSFDATQDMLTLGTTYHVAATISDVGDDASADASTGTLVLYVNGQQVKTMPLHAPLLYGNDGIGIGGSSMEAHSSFDGIIDEVAIYGTALSADRIRAHYMAATGM